MAERFTRLFSLSGNLYAEGSPIVIAAGALQKDNQTEKIFAQLKFKSITDKKIKAVKVKVFPLDTIGNEIEGVVEHEYLDLSVARDEEFGQKTPVIIPNASTRGFSVEVTAVYFADNSAWNGENSEWSSLPEPKSLENSLNDLELFKQYKLKYGSNCRVTVSEYKDLWFCTCGALNRCGEKCHFCSREFNALKNVNLEALKADRDARLEDERIQAEEAAKLAEADRVAAVAKARKTKKLAMILVPILIVVVAACVLLIGFINKNLSYNNAVALMNAGEYDDAVAVFVELADFKDSTEQIAVAEELKAEAEKEEKYNKAIGIISNAYANYQKHDNAYKLLREMGDYKDSATILEGFKPILVYEECKERTTEFTYSYNEFGQPTMKQGASAWITTEYFYDNDNILTKTKTAYSNGSAGVKYIITEYNSEGFPVKIHNEDNGQTWRFTYNCSKNGVIESLTCEFTNPHTTASKTFDLTTDRKEYLMDYKVGSSSLHLKTITDSKHYQEYGIFSNGYNNPTIGIYATDSAVLDEYGNPISSTEVGAIFSQKPWSANYDFENVYDEFGNLIKAIKTDVQTGKTQTYEYTYNHIYCPDVK